jgi:hypothetical protein
MFFILAPFILARPAAASTPYLMPQSSDAQSFERATAVDPVLRYLQRLRGGLLAICVAIAVLVTLSTWWRRDFAPPESIAPNAAIAFVNREGITGNVFNDYSFGGYLIFSNIPTFVDGRALPFGDEFLHKYVDTVNLIDSANSFKLLDDYKVNWVILNPIQPLSRALAQNAQWNEVYSDKYSAVFVRRR